MEEDEKEETIPHRLISLDEAIRTDATEGKKRRRMKNEITNAMEIKFKMERRLRRL